MRILIDIIKTLVLLVLIVLAIKYRKTIKNTVVTNSKAFTTWIKDAK